MKTERRSVIKKLVASVAGITGLGIAARAANANENKGVELMQAGQQKLAHINTQELLQAMPEMKTADGVLEGYQKGLQSSLQLMSTEYDKKMTAYQDKLKTRTDANKEAVDKELQAMGAELGDIEKRIQDADQKAQQDYKTKSDEVFNPILAKATAAVNAVAKEKGYAYVLDISQATVVYFDGGENILNLVKAKLGIAATPATPPATRPAATNPAPK